MAYKQLMSGFGKENLNSKQDDDPPETRPPPAKTPASPTSPRRGPAEAFRRDLAGAARVRFSSPDCGGDQVAFRARVLKELASGLGKAAVYKELVEPNLDAVLGLVAASIFRPLRSGGWREGPGEAEEPTSLVATDLNWVHLKPAYDVLHQLFLNPLVDRKQLRDLVDAKFIAQYLDLFESEDPLERESLKVTLHRIYVHLVSRRKQIRAKIGAIFEAAAHDLVPHPGLADLVEFYASIVSGFNSPLQEEHLRAFRGTVLPLQKLPNYRDFQKPLGVCLTLFVCKEEALAPEVVKSILRFWPHGNTKKEAAFLAQLLGVVEHLKSLDVLEPLLPALLKRLARSVASFSAPACDRALLFFLNPPFVAALRARRRLSLSLFQPALALARTRQWSKNLARVLDKVAQILADLAADASPDASEPHPDFARSLEATPAQATHRSAMEARWEALVAEAVGRDSDFVEPALPYTDRRQPGAGWEWAL